MTQRIANAEAQCGVAWQIGAFTPEGSSDDTNLPVPNLFTCLLRDGRLGVFPVTDGIDCAGLGLKAP
ncbi:hypothetical protein [Microbacterium suwonense]|nr:hypothetical protein [Microbacterium suwonense]